MKKFMSDKEIVQHLMNQNFEDDNTFSKCPKGYAILRVYTNRSKQETIVCDAQFEDLGNIEIKLFNKKTFYEFFKENRDKIIFQGIQGLSPIISIGEV